VCKKVEFGAGVESGAMGSFFFRFSLVVVVVLIVGGDGGLTGACTGICIDIPFV
jgi:ABC-type branched-subunit amino acid transport system permease subunit